MSYKRGITAGAIAMLAVLVALVVWMAGSGTGIRILGEDSGNLAAYSAVVRKFTESTGITVSIEGASFEKAMEKADADFAASAGTFDLILQYNFSLSPYVEGRFVRTLAETFDPLTARDYLDGARLFQNVAKEICFYAINGSPTAEAQQIGLPFAANTMLLVTNRRILEEAAHKALPDSRNIFARTPPTSWEDYLLLAQEVGKATGAPPVCVQGAPGGWLYYELCNYLFSLGSGTSKKKYGWEATDTLTIDTPANVRALEYYLELVKISAGDYFTTDASEQLRTMAAGKTAFAIMWSDYVQPLAKDGRFSFSPIPGKVSPIAGGAFFVNRNSRKPSEAASFLKYALQPDTQEELLLAGLCSAVPAAYTPRVLERVPYATALRDSLERGVFMFEASSDAEIISSALTTHVQQLVRGSTSPSEALRAAQQEVKSKTAK